MESKKTGALGVSAMALLLLGSPAWAGSGATADGHVTWATGLNPFTSPYVSSMEDFGTKSITTPSGNSLTASSGDTMNATQPLYYYPKGTSTGPATTPQGGNLDTGPRVDFYTGEYYNHETISAKSTAPWTYFSALVNFDSYSPTDNYTYLYLYTSSGNIKINAPTNATNIGGTSYATYLEVVAQAGATITGVFLQTGTYSTAVFADMTTSTNLVAALNDTATSDVLEPALPAGIAIAGLGLTMAIARRAGRGRDADLRQGLAT